MDRTGEETRSFASCLPAPDQRHWVLSNPSALPPLRLYTLHSPKQHYNTTHSTDIQKSGIHPGSWLVPQTLVQKFGILGKFADGTLSRACDPQPPRGRARSAGPLYVLRSRGVPVYCRMASRGIVQAEADTAARVAAAASGVEVSSKEADSGLRLGEAVAGRSMPPWRCSSSTTAVCPLSAAILVTERRSLASTDTSAPSFSSISHTWMWPCGRGSIQYWCRERVREQEEGPGQRGGGGKGGGANRNFPTYLSPEALGRQPKREETRRKRGTAGLSLRGAGGGGGGGGGNNK